MQHFVCFIKFCVVGFSNTILSYLLNVIFLVYLKKFDWKYDYILTNTISFTISIFWSFYWNNKYVFSVTKAKKRNWKQAFIKTFLSYGFTGYILNNILLYIWVSIFSISKYIAPIVNLAISIPLNFILNKYWAFKI